MLFYWLLLQIIPSHITKLFKHRKLRCPFLNELIQCFITVVIFIQVKNWIIILIMYFGKKKTISNSIFEILTFFFFFDY